jgi:hypothetical protein
MFNELEIIAWRYAIFLTLTYKLIDENVEGSIIKFRNPDELVLACAIFAKVRHY